jgi:hypothetical protein
MRDIRFWRRLAVWVPLLAPAAARAQVPVIPINPFADVASETPSGEVFGDTVLPEAPKRRVRRLQVGAYAAHWEFAPIQDKSLGNVSERLTVDTSYLIGLDYFISRELSLGGWLNPLHGSEFALEPGARSEFKVADVDASFGDVHATYYPPIDRQKSWSLQIGFSHIHYDVDVVQGLEETGASDFVVKQSSLNFWLNKVQAVGSRRIGGRRRLIRVFGSLGYYTSSQFDRAWNIIFGGAVPLTEQLSFSSSVWFNDLGDTNTRVTAGLAGSF